MSIAVSTVSIEIEKIMKQYCAMAEKVIEERITQVAIDAIEKNKAKILLDVKNELTVHASAALVQHMDGLGMRLEFTFKPKDMK